MIPFTIEYIFVLIGAFLLSIILTPIIRVISLKVGAVDKPNARRINNVPMPSSGGLAIFLSFVVTTLFFMPMAASRHFIEVSYFHYILPVIIGGLVVTTTGFIDDIFELRPRYKMLGIIIAAIIIWKFTHFRFDSFKIPIGGPLLEFGPILTFFLTVLWIISITNAINLIDGLDAVSYTHLTLPTTPYV